VNIPVLTIDGPSWAGKGTVSRSIARQLGWHYLDSGAIYRSLAIAVSRKSVKLEDIAEISRIGQTMHLEFDCADELSVKLDGDDITSQLGLESTGNAASIIAAYPEVRHVLLKKQQDFKQAPGLVADGRDMGTVVFSDAPYKVYLTASPEKRAERRYKQLKEKGVDANLICLTAELEERDRRDRGRSTAPLSMASGAFFIDSSDMTIDQVIQEILRLLE